MNLLIKTSTWAKQNPWSARILIVSSHVLLTIFAILLGFILTNLGISIPGYILLTACLMFSIGLIIYPMNAEKRVRYSKIQFYQRQKLADLMLAGASFIMVLQLGNSYSNSEMKPVQKVWSITAQACYVKFTQTEATASTIEKAAEKQVEKNIPSRKEKRSTMQAKVKAFLSQINMSSEGGKTGLGILLIIGSLGLLFLVVALACNLSCSGAEGAAIMVGILGGAAIIFLLLKAFKMMGKKKNSATP
jgi:hypothetical protein